MKTLYISDLDGTLLNSQGKISNYTIKNINNLVDQGMIFTYATARSLVSASPVTKGLTKNLPLIIYNGTFIVNGEDGKIIHKNIFDNNQVDVVKQVMESNGLKPMVYALINDQERVTIINQNLHDGVKHYLSNRQKDYRINLTIDENNLYQGEVFYFTVIGDYQDLQPAYENLKDYPDFNITFQQEIYREEYWLEIMPKNASKASAILKLKELLKCDYVIAFGDAVNDIPMFKIANECYAMNNAVSILKQHATSVIQSNDEDGVARWLNEHFKK